MGLMAVYAQVANGIVVEIFSPPPGLTIEQCFHAALTWVDITGRFPQPQVGWTATFSSGIWTMAPPVPVTLTVQQQAQAILGTSVQVVSASRPALSGTYPIDSDSRIDVVAEMLSIGANQTFTNGTTTMNILDTSNNPHTFDVPHYTSYAVQIGVFITALKMAAAGKSTTLPTQPMQIM
jgi:hypothetical protein